MTIRLYHGSQNEQIEPQYGLGQGHHDFGKGFYLTDVPELAREWAVYRPKFNRLDRLFSDVIREVGQ